MNSVDDTTDKVIELYMNHTLKQRIIFFHERPLHYSNLSRIYKSHVHDGNELEMAITCQNHNGFGWRSSLFLRNFDLL